MQKQKAALANQQAVAEVSVNVLTSGSLSEARADSIANEAPLQIQLQYWKNADWRRISLVTTMRTPGQDEALALGFLIAEGIIANKSDVQEMRLSHEAWQSRVVVTLQKEIELNKSFQRRIVVANSSCGVCSRQEFDDLSALPDAFADGSARYTPSLLLTLANTLRKHQQIFQQTGGVHAAALFDDQGKLLGAAEDIGRHNALDKIIGAGFTEGYLPSSDCVLLLSGRVGFELVQKAAMAKIEVIVALGAPSLLAVDIASKMRMTLIGFASPDQANIYCGNERIALADSTLSEVVS